MAKLIYRCNLCAGTVFYRVEEDTLAMAVIHRACYGTLPTKANKKVDEAYKKSIIHKCSDKCYGIADLVGIET